MFEYKIIMEENIPPINDVLERMKTFLVEEFQKRKIPEFSMSQDLNVLISCTLNFQDMFYIDVFDGVVIGKLRIHYDDIMSEVGLKVIYNDLFNRYFEYRKTLNIVDLLPCYAFYKAKTKLSTELALREISNITRRD